MKGIRSSRVGEHENSRGKRETKGRESKNKNE
jgi:hypothetical protein